MAKRYSGPRERKRVFQRGSHPQGDRPGGGLAAGHNHAHGPRSFSFACDDDCIEEEAQQAGITLASDR